MVADSEQFCLRGASARLKDDRMRIALFTPYSPEIGGGSVQLRSHLERMPGLDVTWYYLASKPVAGERRKFLGAPLTSGQWFSDLSARSGFLPGSKTPVREFVKQMDADLYWVVGHYEGISIAAELLDQGKQVHLTVHDEPLAMIIRSRRYRLLYPFLAQTFRRVLLGAKSVDVTSWGMRDYFKQKYHVNCLPLYLSHEKLPEVSFAPSQNELRIGHIGSLYHPEPFRRFLNACRGYAAKQNRALKIVRIGDSAEMDQIAAEGPKLFESHGEMDEPAAVAVLAECDFCYAMYPDGFRFQGFRRTSMPIKLSTYILAQRPIFAHTPTDSGMASVVQQYQLGIVCPTSNGSELLKSIEDIVRLQVAPQRFELIRNDLMGLAQVEDLRTRLLA